MSIDMKSATELAAVIADGHAVDGARNAIRFYVSYWYADKDGSDAVAKPDSPVMKVIDAAEVLPGALAEIERLRDLLRQACSKLKPSLPNVAKSLRERAGL